MTPTDNRGFVDHNAERLRGRVAALQASVRFFFACLRYSGHYGAFSTLCVQCHQVQITLPMHQYLCFLTVYTLHIRVRRSQQQMINSSVNVITKPT